MLGPLVKAQLVALLTKKLLESPAFHSVVGAAHGTVSRLQEQAYSALESAVAEGDRLQSPAEKAQTIKDHPKPEQPVVKQNDALQRFIERTRRDLEDEERNSRS